jgi:S1-C subfamily serine protease
MVVHCFPEIAGQTSVEELVKRMSVPVSQGTAFAVASDKFVTCNHVIKNLDPKMLKLSGAADPTAGLPMNIHDVVEAKCDPLLDIALLKTRRVQGDIVPITFESGLPQVGLDILAVGYPFPEQQPPEIRENEKRINVNAVTTFRALRGIIASRFVDGLHFEIDKLANHGQSGGPIISIENGKSVGMCQAYQWFEEQTEKQTAVMPADLSVCINADAIRGKLNDWGVSVE